MRIERYREYDPKLFKTPPKLAQEWEPPQDHGSSSEMDNEGFEVPNGPQFD